MKRMAKMIDANTIRILSDFITKYGYKCLSLVTDWVKKHPHQAAEIGLASALSAVTVRDVVKSVEQKEKDRLYQDQIRKQDAEISKLEETAEKSERLEKVVQVLQDIIVDNKLSTEK